MERWLWVAAWLAVGYAVPLPHEVDSEQTRKLLGSSVVTSVSVIMDHGNGTKTYITDGDTQKKPQVVGTPGTLLSPDRYEFYSFGEDGELVKKLMTLDQIQSLIAGGDELDSLPVYDPQPLIDNTHTEGVHKVLESVQNVLKGELQAAKIHPKLPMPLPDDSWSILLPGLLHGDLDMKEPDIPPKTETTTAKTSTLSQNINKVPNSTRRPTQSTTVRSTSRPTSQTTMSQQTSTLHFTQAQQSTKPFAESRPTTTYSTSPPYVKTTVSNKPPSQKPPATSKKPILTTKKPYISETPLVKVSLATTQKLESTTKPTSTSKMPTTVVEERIPSTKFPETKKPIPEKQKPSGIPTITHYMPISSMSPFSSTSASLTESYNLNQKLTSKEPVPVTTTKRPSTYTTSRTTTQKFTRRPVLNRDPPINNKTQPINITQNEKLSIKSTSPTVGTTSTTTIQNEMTTASTTIAVKATTEPIVTNEQLSTSTEKLETHPETVTIGEPVSTTPVPMNSSVSLDQDKYVLEKHSQLGPQSNLIGENSNIINTKVNPSTSPTVITTTSDSTEKVTLSSTPFPEKFTTFSYTSKITPNGEIITISQPTTNFTQDKSTTGSSFETTVVSTKLPTTVNIKTTEKPIERVTSLPHHSAKPIETVQDQILISSSMQPTTYHPHNFSFPPEKNKIPVISSTTPISTTIITHSLNEELKKDTITIAVPITEQPSHNSTDPIQLPLISNSSTISGAITLQSVTKPTTIIDTAEETTIAATTPISKASETTINDATTYSTEEIPLQEIPLKIYESLKDNVGGAQELLTTILSENLSTTPGKLENFYSTNYEATVPTTTTDKATTMFDVVSSIVFPQNNFVIVNNSEPHILEKNALSSITSSESEANATTTNEPIQFSTEIPIDRNSSAYESTSQDEATTLVTTVSVNNSDQENIETTPNLDTTTIYKDHIIQEGISAVTSILLDQAQNQQAMKQAIIGTEIKNNDIFDMERIRTTTEDERVTTTMSDSTETSTGKFSTDGDQMKSEVRHEEDAELPEKFTTVPVETTTQDDKPKTDTQPIKGEINASNNISNNKQQLKKTEQKSTSVIPTKESKLNPDTDHGFKKKTSNKQHADNIPLLRTSPLPEFIATTERLRIPDSEKPVPKPLNPFVKKPSSVYQSLENLPPVAIELNPAPYESMGLEASIAFLGEDVRRFADLCNELAFKLWTSITGKGQIASRSLVMSPFAVTSLLAMVFLGARGPTSGQMNDVLRLDDMVTFNPHQVLQNVTESVINSKNNGIATAAFVRELYSDKTKGKILDFYKERVQQYYQGHVEEVTFTTIGDIIRRRTNLLVKRQTLGKVPEYLRGSSLNMRPPLAAFSANIFQTDCEQGSTEGRDGEMYFVVRPSTRQRRLVPVPAVVWRSGFLAGYEPSLDATSVCLGPESVVSTILILPGQQGQVAPGDGLARLEQRLIETPYRRGSWSQILRSLMPRPGLELQVPRFSHRSVLNMTRALQRMGLRDLFNAQRADLRGLNGLSNDLHLSDMLQVNTFSTCGEETIGARHHVETYPASPQRIGRDETDHYSSRDFDNSFGDLHLSMRPRQARLPDNPRLRFDRPFLYMVRHNPSGMILHMGRFNPRLLP